MTTALPHPYAPPIRAFALPPRDTSPRPRLVLRPYPLYQPTPAQPDRGREGGRGCCTARTCEEAASSLRSCSERAASERARDVRTSSSAFLRLAICRCSRDLVSCKQQEEKI